MNVLFLQLPQLDNDVSGAHENVPLAAAYLEYALRRDPHTRRVRTAVLPVKIVDADDHAIIRHITRTRPDVIACTLYLWNIERTLHILKSVRARLPRTRVIAGGPEVAHDHPFLFRSDAVDVAVVGEGEPVFPLIIRALRRNRMTNFRNVAWRKGARWTWGKNPPPRVALRDMLPPPGWKHSRPDAKGMAYLETTRGCPLDCSYCSYNQRRTRVSALPPEEVARRIRKLQSMGAKEIRFIDPTFNANPLFEELVRAIARANRGRKLSFFAELRPDRITREHARLLAKAGFTDIEVGIQSLDRRVLQLIRRPVEIRAAERGIRALTAAGIKVTLDLMYGLPGQSAADVKRSVRWASGRRRVQVQCLQTLLLPGTDVRRERGRFGMMALATPPYGVTATRTMRGEEMVRCEEFIERTLGYAYDCPTKRFVGRELPDLFAERMVVRAGVGDPGYSRPRLQLQCDTGVHFPIIGNRKAVIFQGLELFAERESNVRSIRDAVSAEPFIPWQFVLSPEVAFPLDLLDLLIAELRRFEPLVMDHFLGPRHAGRRASRRVMVLLRRGRKYDPDWAGACEELLKETQF